MKDFGLFKLGATEAMDPELRRVTILSNMVYVVIGSIVIFYILIRGHIYLNPTELAFSSWIPVIILSASIACLLLNRAGFYVLSKSIFITSWILFTTVFLFVLYGSIQSDYLVHPFYCIISSIMVHILFSYYSERAIYLFFVVITWSLILFSNEFITYFLLTTNTPPPFKFNLTGWRISNYMFAAFFNLTILYVIRLNYRFYSDLQVRNNTVSLQNKRLEEQQRELENLMQKLEEKVLIRTLALKEQNERLTEYAFFNSHILRAPVSRIRGLVNLLGLTIDKEEENKIRGLLSDCMNELDQAIIIINSKLDEVHPPESTQWENQ
jgi:signal transduction histidine kinase